MALAVILRLNSISPAAIIILLVTGARFGDFEPELTGTDR
jgi:hypothetical protein